MFLSIGYGGCYIAVRRTSLHLQIQNMFSLNREVTEVHHENSSQLLQVI